MRKLNRFSIFLGIVVVLVLGLAVIQFARSQNQTSTQTRLDPEATPLVFGKSADGSRHTFTMNAWADNWFAAYVDEDLLIEDSVPITTERSFNAESVSFEASYPLNLNFILKDYKANDTGLEYIGAQNQQMGDGGFIMQVKDVTSGALVGVSDDSWICLVTHEAPLDKTCEKSSNPVAGTAPCNFTAVTEPEGWKRADFNDSKWEAAHVYTEEAVKPKDGYYQITWDNSAHLIWGPDLETDNTLLCRMTINAPNQ